MVDGQPVQIGDKADPATARIEIDGSLLPVRPDAVYYLMYKPIGTISTRSDERGRPTVVELVPSEPPVYPVGRLDSDSEGLLILTNDGDLTHLVTHPRFGMTKTYTVLTTGALTTGDIRSLEAGVELEDGPARARSARLIDVGSEGTLLEVVMEEGRKREVRRMVAALGQEVKRLVRTAIGPIRDQKLKAGEWRHLSAEEIWKLCAVAGNADDTPVRGANSRERMDSGLPVEDTT